MEVGGTNHAPGTDLGPFHGIRAALCEVGRPDLAVRITGGSWLGDRTHPHGIRDLTLTYTDGFTPTDRDLQLIARAQRIVVGDV